jgi:hypothetical protein
VTQCIPCVRDIKVEVLDTSDNVIYGRTIDLANVLERASSIATDLVACLSDLLVRLADIPLLLDEPRQ